MTRRSSRRPTLTLETPRGVYTLRGDPTGSQAQRSLRLNGGRWRKGHADEWRLILETREARDVRPA